jgi:hypothetical protein
VRREPRIDEGEVVVIAKKGRYQGGGDPLQTVKKRDSNEDVSSRSIKYFVE